MADNGSLQWTAKVSKERLKNLIHSYMDMLDLERQNDPKKPDCPEFENFGIFPSRCRFCDHYADCRKYNDIMRQHRINEHSNTSLRKHLEAQSRVDLGHYTQHSKGMILCYLVLYMLHPDDNGCIRDVSFSLLSKMTSLAASTVRKCMEKLRENGYISYGRDRYDIDYGFYDFIINDYRKTFYPAALGGQGYVHINNDTWSSLRSLPVNDLRITLLALCRADRADNAEGCVEVKYRDYAQYLPGYVCRKVFNRLLRSMTDNDHGLFKILQKNDNYAVLSYRSGMDARKEYLNSRSKLSEDIESYCKSIDFCMERLRFGPISSPLAEKIINLCDANYNYKALSPGKTLIDDMVSICIDFTADIVKKAYLSYICHGGNVKNTKTAGRKIRQICSGFLGITSTPQLE